MYVHGTVAGRRNSPVTCTNRVLSAASEITGGKMSVFQATMPEAFSPPRHIHTREDEVFLVLDGEVCFDLDGRKRLAGPV